MRNKFNSWLEFFLDYSAEEDNGQPASWSLLKSENLFPFPHLVVTLHRSIMFFQIGPNYTLLTLLMSFLALLQWEGRKKTRNGPPSRTAFYTHLISMLGCLNCLLEGWREIEQYPLALETSPIASHLFLCRARTDLGATPLRKPSPLGGQVWVGQDKSINISSIKVPGTFWATLYCVGATWEPTVIMWINC